MRRMDSPDQRVARDRIERFPVVRDQRAQLNEGMQESWLQGSHPSK
jgi:hypothetical protein